MLPNRKIYEYIQDSTFSRSLNFEFLNKIQQKLPLYAFAAGAAFDTAHEINSGHSGKRKALLDFPKEKVEY